METHFKLEKGLGPPTSCLLPGGLAIAGHLLQLCMSRFWRPRESGFCLWLVAHTKRTAFLLCVVLKHLLCELTVTFPSPTPLCPAPLLPTRGAKAPEAGGEQSRRKKVGKPRVPLHCPLLLPSHPFMAPSLKYESVRLYASDGNSEHI